MIKDIIVSEKATLIDTSTKRQRKTWIWWESSSYYM